MLDKARALLQKAKRRSWMKYALRGVSANDNFERLDLAYSIEDPWNMDSPAEQTRFARGRADFFQSLPAGPATSGCGD